jgi:hypothetical protein
MAMDFLGENLGILASAARVLRFVLSFAKARSVDAGTSFGRLVDPA